METHDVDPAGDNERASLGDSLHTSRLRMAGRLRSPWWFHVLYGLALACIAFGVTDRTVWGLALLVLGLAGEIAAGRWRATQAGFSRANPSRFTFLWSGTPWSAITYAVFIAALAVGVLDRSLPLGWLAAITGFAGLIAAALGPLADRRTRRHLARAAS